MWETAITTLEKVFANMGASPSEAARMQLECLSCPKLQ
jgi:hypothetical protein